jgi:glycerophosphoryl diester phosphodiesterase
MELIIFLGFLLMSLNCDLTRHSGDVLKRNKIFIEAHRGVTEGQKNHNTKEAILNSINNGIESFETDAWLTYDKKVVLLHDGYLGKFSCKNLTRIKIHFGLETCPEIHVNQLMWSELQDCETKEGQYKIPLLEDIMIITKGKIFMNLEIKDDNHEIWEKIKELIEKYEYFDPISICSFNSKFYEYVE